jgi:hypothetical protein
MRKFLAATGTVFAIVCTAWASRLILGWPIQVAGFDVPVMFSLLPMLVTGALAIWAFRLIPQAKT